MPLADTETTTILPPGPANAEPPLHQALAAQITALGQSVARLASEQHAAHLIMMVHRPGWTTKPEAQLVSAMVNHLQDQITGLHQAHDALLAAADSIGRS